MKCLHCGDLLFLLGDEDGTSHGCPEEHAAKNKAILKTAIESTCAGEITVRCFNEADAISVKDIAREHWPNVKVHTTWLCFGEDK